MKTTEEYQHWNRWNGDHVPDQQLIQRTIGIPSFNKPGKFNWRVDVAVLVSLLLLANEPVTRCRRGTAVALEVRVPKRNIRFGPIPFGLISDDLLPCM